MKGFVSFINQRKWLKTTISSVVIIAIYFICCVNKYMPSSLNVLHLFDGSSTEATTTKEGNELVPLGDKMYFQDKLVEEDFYKVNGTLSIPVSRLCKALGYEYSTDDDKTVIRTDTTARTLEISSKRYLENDGGFKGKNDFKELNHKTIKYEEETYIAYEDVSTVFSWLKTATLKSGKRCVYDPEPFIPIGITLEQSYDKLAKAYAGEGKLLTIEEFRQLKKIPAQISLDTDENIFFNTMSISSYYGEDYPAMEQSLKQMGVSDYVLQSGSAQYGKVMDELTIAQVIQSNDIGWYLEQNGLTEDLIGFKVDKNTKFKDVRNVKTINEIDQNEKQEELSQLEVTIAPTETPSPSPEPTETPDMFNVEPSETPEVDALPSATAMPSVSSDVIATKRPSKPQPASSKPQAATEEPESRGTEEFKDKVASSGSQASSEIEHENN